MYSSCAAMMGGHSAQSRNSSEPCSLVITLPDCAAVMPKTSTFSAMSTYVTIGEGRSERTGAPAMVRACGVDRSAAATQSTQC